MATLRSLRNRLSQEARRVESPQRRRYATTGAVHTIIMYHTSKRYFSPLTIGPTPKQILVYFLTSIHTATMQREERPLSGYRPRILIYSGPTGSGKTCHALIPHPRLCRARRVFYGHQRFALNYMDCEVLLIDDIEGGFRIFLEQLGIGQDMNKARVKRMVCGERKAQTPCRKLPSTIIFTTNLSAEELIPANTHILGSNYKTSFVNPVVGTAGFFIYDFPGEDLSPQCFQ
jgi:hypothetical protein